MTSQKEAPPIKTLADIPTPSGIGETFKILKVLRSPSPEVRGKFMYNYFLDIWARYGDVVALHPPGRDPMVVLFDPDHAEIVYRASGSRPRRDGFYALDFKRR